MNPFVLFYARRSVAVCACLLLVLVGAVGATVNEPVPESLYALQAGHNRIDDLVFASLRGKGVPPSGICPDEVFVRRVFLDVIGTLPNSGEVRRFLDDSRPDKRARLIDTLLDRDEYAAYWGLKWGDLLRIKAEFPSNLWPNAVQTYDRWVRESVRLNKPYDQFVRELLTSSGSNFRSPPANFYRAFQGRTPRQIADNVALLFMGVRLDGSGFTEDQILAFSAFFAKIGYKGTDEWKEEIVFFNPDGILTNAVSGRPVIPRTLDGRVPRIAADEDPRSVFAEWLTAPDNPWFARCMVNRIWFWLLGRGLVHEPDDMRASNPPWSPELLDYLGRELVGHKFDLKHIYRLILNSSAYQASSLPNAWNSADEEGFSRYRPRRLDAEVLLDAINQITGTGEKYTSSIPEPFTFLPDDQRAIELADGSIEHPFLELFGRPSRNTSFESERSSLPSVFQAQHLLNSSHIQKKIERSRELKELASPSRKKPVPAPPPRPDGKAKGKAETQVVGGLKKPFELKSAADNPGLVDELYLRILSRFPTGQEAQVARDYLADPKRSPADSVCDLAWALINTTEFLVKH